MTETSDSQTTNSSPQHMIGALLKKERELRSLSLKNIADQTKIHYTLLEHLEADQLRKLPQKTYVVGFIKSYAKVLGLSQELCLKALEASYDKEFPKPVIQQNAPQTSDEKNVQSNSNIKKESAVANISKKVPMTPKSLSLIFGAAAGATALGAAIYFYTNTVPTPSLIPEAQTVSTEKVTIPEVEKIEEKKEVALAPIKIAPVEAKEKIQEPIEEKEVAIQPVATPVKTPELKVEPKPTLIPVPVVKQVAPIVLPAGISLQAISEPLYSVNDKEVAPPELKRSVVSGKENVLIYAGDGDSWIAYKVDNDRVKRYVLSKGKYLKLVGSEVLLYLGNARATKIYLNNKLVEAPTQSGVKSLIFPMVNQKKYKLPLFIKNDDGSFVTSKDLDR